MERPRTYAPATKLAASKAIVDHGDTRAEVLQRFKIRFHATLTAWVRRHRELGPDAFTLPIERRERSRRIRARHAIDENTALTELIAPLDATMSTSEKVQIVASLAGRHPVRPLLRALRLPASTYYYRRSRPPKVDRYESVRPVLRTELGSAYNA